jgi:nicotinamide mononucleotide transporter
LKKPYHLQEIWQQFLSGIKATGWMEYMAVCAGIISVWFSQKENILVYPTGLINTIFYVYLSFKASLYGEAGVNLYYTIMSFYGWAIWSKKNIPQAQLLQISFSDKRWWHYQLLFFSFFYITIFTLLTYLKKDFSPGVIPWADAFASATAFTGMWLMTKKKVESWYWWIATNIASIPLYFVKQYVFTSVYYFILLIMAGWGLQEWRKKAKQNICLKKSSS